eukprot:260744-Rhodomonas_salina.1
MPVSSMQPVSAGMELTDGALWTGARGRKDQPDHRSRPHHARQGVARSEECGKESGWWLTGARLVAGMPPSTVFKLPEGVSKGPKKGFSLAQKMVGKACGTDGISPGSASLPAAVSTRLRRAVGS